MIYESARPHCATADLVADLALMVNRDLEIEKLFTLQRSLEGLSDAKLSFEDQFSYPELKFGGRQLSFQTQSVLLGGKGGGGRWRGWGRLLHASTYTMDNQLVGGGGGGGREWGAGWGGGAFFLCWWGM